MKKERLYLSSDVHRKQKAVCIKFERNRKVIDLLKAHFPVQWSQSKNAGGFPEISSTSQNSKVSYLRHVKL